MLFRSARLLASLGRLRLASGLVLFSYVTLHLANHAAGLVSVGAMETLAAWMYDFLHFPPAAWTLYGALLVHFVLALYAIHRRRRLWPMAAPEALQLILGLSVIPLLAGHAVGTRLAGALHGVIYSHTYVLIELEIGRAHV